MNFLNFKDKKQEEHLCLSLRLNPLLLPKKKKKKKRGERPEGLFQLVRAMELFEYDLIEGKTPCDIGPKEKEAFPFENLLASAAATAGGEGGELYTMFLSRLTCLGRIEGRIGGATTTGVEGGILIGSFLLAFQKKEGGARRKKKSWISADSGCAPWEAREAEEVGDCV